MSKHFFIKKFGFLYRILVAVCAFLSFTQITSAQPTPPYPLYPYPGNSPGVPLSIGDEIFATGGDVIITYLGWQGSEFNEYIFVSSPSNALGQVINDDYFRNSTTAAGMSINLGSFTNGAEIEFGLYVESTGTTWFDGPGSRNSDGAVHAYATNNYEGQAGLIYVGFEDEAFPGGDFNYTDEVFTVLGANAVPPLAKPVTLETVQVQSGNFVFNGANGVSNQTFVILTSTNLSAPIGSCWTPIATNTFGTNGNFSISISADFQQQFFKISLQ